MIATLKLVVAQTWEAVAHPWEPMVPSGSKVGDRGEVGGGAERNRSLLCHGRSVLASSGKIVW